MFTTLGALIGLAAAIVLIVRRTVPAYALIVGALIGGIAGGGGLADTVKAMISGTQSMMPSVLRILASGVLVGALVRTGSAAKIADAIVTRLGERFALAAVALAAMAVCAVGVFIDIAVITAAPVALAVGARAKLPVPALLLAMIGGGKAGNIISPNPNTIAAADAFKVDLTELMAANIIPALFAFAATLALSSWLASRCRRRSETFASPVAECGDAARPALWSALSGPVTVVGLLALRPFAGIAVDPLVALPAGGIVSAIACGKWRNAVEFSQFGLGKVSGVAILLIGTGTIAGIIRASDLNTDMIALLGALKLPMAALAPVSGILMAGATASTTAGATIASQTFSGALVEAGVAPVSAAATIHAGATVADSLPHGSFFHATGGSVFMSVGERLKLIPYEAAVGLVATAVSCCRWLT
ncbi:MAG: GntP family permease [Kiritimatiellae bacterium]|nr:GntP family permease [Kiritimatiellia bacterium]